MAVSDALAVELHHESPSARAWRRLLRRKSAGFGLVVIVLFVLIAVFAPVLTPYDPAQQGWPRSASRRRCCTGSAPMSRGAISSPA